MVHNAVQIAFVDKFCISVHIFVYHICIYYIFVFIYHGFRLDKCTMIAMDIDLRDKNHSQGLDDALHQLRNSSCSIAFHHGIENVDNTFVFSSKCC